MPRRKRLRGKLIQKSKKHLSLEKRVKIIATRNEMTDIWTEGEFSSVEEALDYLDKIRTSDVTYNVYSDSNRVVYTRQGGIDA